MEVTRTHTPAQPSTSSTEHSGSEVAEAFASECAVLPPPYPPTPLPPSTAHTAGNNLVLASVTHLGTSVQWHLT